MATFEDDKFIAAYNQNAEHFRSLNGLMWQIPLIAMTLTGGLWFGVSKVEANKAFQVCLLLLAVAGNLGLIVALGRLRYIMGCYLTWFENAYPEGHVSAKGEGLFTRSRLVQRTFQALLGLAAAISLFLIGVTFRQELLGGLAAVIAFLAGVIFPVMSSDPTSLSSVAYYDRHAVELADGYEAISFEAAHPDLVPLLTSTARMKVLEVGAGSGRDAAWIAGHGHDVTAVEPSAKMRQLAQKRHPSDKVVWIDGALPELRTVSGGDYDLILLSAVWMHILPGDRPKALQRLAGLLGPEGAIYLTLRLGPTDKARSIHAVSFEELARLAQAQHLDAQLLGDSSDLLSRADVHWQKIELKHAPTPVAKVS